MGLDCSHDAWHGAYSSFGRWRNAVAVAGGYTLKPAETTYGPREFVDIDWDAFEDRNLMGEWDRLPEDPLLLLIVHSDCDGELKPEACRWLALRMERLLPDITDDYDRERAEQFIAGLRDAHANGEPLEFG